MPIELIAYEGRPPDDWVLEPAPTRRDWMEQTQEKVANRCLPLTMANQAGWVIRCPVRFKATWNGKTEPAGTTLEFPEQEKLYAPQITKYFGSGIITFGLPWLFRTSEPYGMLVRGPTNFFIQDAVPLDGLVETNWAPYTFTMNWKITRPRTAVWFRKGDPICMIIPFHMETLEQVQPRFASLDSDPELRDEFLLWAHTRAMQNQRRAKEGAQLFSLAYIRGKGTLGEKSISHKTGLKVAPFAPKPPESA